MFKVYKNIEFNPKPIDSVPASKAAMKKWVRQNVRSTHMGQWVKLVNGFEYATTIGEYYLFIEERD